jgi:hypothetical protein
MSERTTKEQTAVLLGTAVPGDSGNKSTPDSMRCQRHGKIGCGGCWLDALQGQTVTGWLRKMQAEIRAEGHAGWGNTLDDAIAFIERLTSPVPAEQPKPSPCVEPSGSTGPADAQKIVDAVLRFVDYDTDGHWWCDVAKARGAVKKLLAGPADAGSHETLQQRAEDLWEEVGGGLCICTISTVGHWCEKCQQRIALIKDALRAASASAPAAPREVGGAAPTSTPLDARGLITEIRAVAIAAGQFSVDVENRELSLQAFEEAARASRWADEMEKILADARAEGRRQAIREMAHLMVTMPAEAFEKWLESRLAASPASALGTGEKR